MKFLFIALSITALLSSCSKDKTTALENNNTTTSGTLKFSGNFIPTGGITVMGSAKVLATGTSNTLLLDSFSISGGPDLKVYLSKAATPTEFINLGPLRSNTGQQSYAIPQGTSFTVYKYALIHCQQYNHLFAIAELK